MRNGSKPLPQDIDAEKAFLGAILLAPNRLLDEQADLQPSDFHHPAHKEIFTQFLAMRSADVPINAVALTGWLNDRHLLEKIGGNGEINDLLNVVPTANGADYYAQRIRKKALARNMVSFGQRVIADANDPAQQENLLTKVQEELTIIAAGGKPEARSLPPMISARDLCLKPPPTPPEVIEGILHQGSKLAFGGGSKSFKTWMLLELSICVATGCDWLGFPTAKGSVLYVNFELPAFAIEKRIREICGAMFMDVPENLIVWNLRGHAADASTILPIVSREAKTAGFTLIILDPLYKLLGQRDENTSRDMTNLMNHVERLAVDTGAATAFGSHYSKGNQSSKESMDRISGSGVFARDPDSIITMTTHEEDKAFTVEMTLRNFAPQEPFVVRREHPLMVIDGQLDPAKLKKPIGRTAEYKPEDLLVFLESEELRTSEWEKAAAEDGIKSRTFFRLKKELVKAGKVFQSKIDKKWSPRV